MKKTKIKNNQSGFGLIQVVIAASLMSVLSLGIAALITNQAQQISYMEDRMSYTNFKGQLSTLLELNAENCTASLAGIKLTNATEKKPANIQIKDKDGKVLFDPRNNSKNQVDKIKIASIKVSDIDVVSGGTGSGQVKITVNPVRIRKGGGPTEMAPIEILQQVNADTSSGNEVVSCSGGASAGIPACVTENFTNYATLPSGVYFPRRSFRAPSATKAIKLSRADGIATRPQETCSGQDRSRADCEIPGFELVIFPGITKYKGSVLPTGQTLSIEKASVGKYVHCDGHREKVETKYYYGNRLVYVYRGKTSRTGCPSHHFPDPNLVANNLPPLCAVANGRKISSLPDNLGFRLYEGDL